MRVVPERSFWLQIIAVFGGFLIGPFAAYRLSVSLVPDSALVQELSPLAFVLVYVGGAVLWLGIGFATLVLAFFSSVIRGRRPGPPSIGPSERIVAPGYRAFVVLGVLVGFGFGLLAGLASGLSVATGVVTYGLLGLGYGLLLWAAAHHGYLPCEP